MISERPLESTSAAACEASAQILAKLEPGAAGFQGHPHGVLLVFLLLFIGVCGISLWVECLWMSCILRDSTESITRTRGCYTNRLDPERLLREKGLNFNMFVWFFQFVHSEKLPIWYKSSSLHYRKPFSSESSPAFLRSCTSLSCQDTKTSPNLSRDSEGALACSVEYLPSFRPPDSRPFVRTPTRAKLLPHVSTVFMAKMAKIMLTC